MMMMMMTFCRLHGNNYYIVGRWFTRFDRFHRYVPIHQVFLITSELHVFYAFVLLAAFLQAVLRVLPVPSFVHLSVITRQTDVFTGKPRRT